MLCPYGEGWEQELYYLLQGTKFLYRLIVLSLLDKCLQGSNDGKVWTQLLDSKKNTINCVNNAGSHYAAAAGLKVDTVSDMHRVEKAVICPSAPTLAAPPVTTNSDRSTDSKPTDAGLTKFKFVRLLMLSNAYRQWAASIWRLEIFGVC